MRVAVRRPTTSIIPTGAAALRPRRRPQSPHLSQKSRLSIIDSQGPLSETDKSRSALATATAQSAPNRTLRPLARDVSTGRKTNNRDKFPAGREDRLSAVGDAKLQAK